MQPGQLCSIRMQALLIECPLMLAEAQKGPWSLLLQARFTVPA
jgi:hypothetical protein